MSIKMVKKIFVIDDDEMLLAAIEDYITRKTKHNVQLFKTGEECLEHLDESPDVIILDYNLNAVYKDAANGMKILEAIKKIDRNIRVIMLSSQEAYGTAMQTINKGAEEYVIKDEASFEKIVAICNE
jgi:two-component system, OmpR family, response regulator